MPLPPAHLAESALIGAESATWLNRPRLRLNRPPGCFGHAAGSGVAGHLISSPFGEMAGACPVDPGNAGKGSWLDCREREGGWEIGCWILNGPCSCERLASMNEFLGLVPALLVVIVLAASVES